MTQTLFGCRMFVVLVCLVGSARADGPAADTVERAKAHYRTGDALYKSGDYAAALREFAAGYELAPRPEFLVNLGQAHRMLHDPRAAISMFEKFLASTPQNNPRRGEVESVLVELRAEAAALPPPAPPAVETVAVPAPVAEPVRPRRHWYRDPLGGALLGVGVATLATGAGLLGYAQVALADAQTDLDHYDRARDALPLRTAGIVLLASGGAVILGGVIRYATIR
jgi:tetratricopeptide (TPR) repeat protein